MNSGGPKPAFYVLLGILIAGLVGLAVFQATKTQGGEAPPAGGSISANADGGDTPGPAPDEEKSKNPLTALFGGGSGPTGKGTDGAKPPARGEVILRLHGSNTIGAKLGPALAKGYLESLGGTEVQIANTGAEEIAVTGTLDGQVVGIELAAHGSATAFTDLAATTADIGMSSRKIKVDEVEALRAFGDLTETASEHVLALDGLAVIVNRANKVTTLSTTQLQQIFAGEIRDWSKVGGAAGEIAIYARDDKSGTYDSFKSLILKEKKLRASAERFEDSKELSMRVSQDPNGIGFIGLPYVLQSRALAVSEPGSRPLFPNKFTVATEDYPLARRLYFYSAEAPQNPHVAPFIDFALSMEGQDIVTQVGFIGQTPEAMPLAEAMPSAESGGEKPPTEYLTLTKGAERLTVNLRFRTGSDRLDPKAVRDLDRLLELLSEPNYAGRSLILLGFADSRGAASANKKLSLARAESVAREFRSRGVDPGVIRGLGSAFPVASNDTAEGREKNRRVEVWVR